MLYSQFISQLRSELKDFGKIHSELFDGDASTLNFILKEVPIKDGSYTVKVGGVTKTETTDYTIDKDTGVVTFVDPPASGSDNVSVSYQSVKIRDADYIQLINEGIDHFRWKFWKEADDTSKTSVANQYEYDLSSLTNILYVVFCWVRTIGSTAWIEAGPYTNWKWLGRQSKLYVDPPLSAGLSLKFRYLKSFAKGTTTSATVDIPDEWLLPYKFYIKARFYENFVTEKISETAAITTLPTYSPAQTVINIVEYYYKKADEMANKIAPKLPPMIIKNAIES